MRKVYVDVQVRLVLNLEDGVEVSEAIDEIEYDFTPQQEHGELLDSEILDYNVIDSK